MGFMQRDAAFAKNLNLCRKYVLGLTCRDLGAVTGMPPATLRSYESGPEPVSPSLSAAKKLADACCVSVERLSSYDVWADAEEVAAIQAKFLGRSGGFVTEEELGGALARVLRSPRVTEHVVFSAAVQTQLLAIRRVCRDAGLPKVREDGGIVTDFTYNLRYLTDLCDVPLKKMGGVCSMGAGTLARLRQGAEPTLSAVIRIADYFGVGVDEILSPGPSFSDPAGIIGRVALKKALSDSVDPVPRDVLERDEIRRAKELGKDEAAKLLERLLAADKKNDMETDI